MNQMYNLEIIITLKVFNHLIQWKVYELNVKESPFTNDFRTT
jgi:hypothetical protein